MSKRSGKGVLVGEHITPKCLAERRELTDSTKAKPQMAVPGSIPRAIIISPALVSG